MNKTWKALFLELMGKYQGYIVQVSPEWQKTINIETLSTKAIKPGFIAADYIVSAETNQKISLAELSDMQYRELYLWVDLYTKFRFMFK